MRILLFVTPVRLRLRDLRAAKGFTQEELASIAQVRQATISQLESDGSAGVSFAVLERLANALGVEPADLIERTPKQPRKRGK